MEKKELKIVTFIKKYSLAKAIDTFKLTCKVYDNKILLKYNQIESPMGEIETQECRGLILERDTWRVLNYTFLKFFNAEEGHAAKINWDTAYVLTKIDGSLIQVYFDWHKEEWCAATSGMGEGEGEVNNKPNSTFAELFWETLYNVNPNFKTKFLNKNFCYAFELTTPYNIIVTPHSISSITLLTARELNTFEEVSYEQLMMVGDILGLSVVKRFNMNVDNVGIIKKTFKNMPFTEEGYVVVDANFNRIKIKNPAYVVVHHLKSKTALHNILNVVKSNEIEEFAATFTERKEEIFNLKEKYDNLYIKLEEVWGILKNKIPKNITKKENKKYAMAVFEVCDEFNVKQFFGLFFGLKDGKIDSIKEFLMEYNNRKLYQMLNNNENG